MKKVEVKMHTQIGNYHSLRNEVNQDYCVTKEDERYFVAVVADGVSTQEKGLKGAKIACDVSVDYVLRRAQDFMEYDQDEVAKYIIQAVMYQLAKEADIEKEDVMKYSSTLMIYVLDKKKNDTMLFNLGDGIILGEKNQQLNYISRGRNYGDATAVTTTQQAYKTMDLKRIKGKKYDSYFIATDGIKEIMKFNELYNFDYLKEKAEIKTTMDDCTFMEIKLINVAKPK